LSASRGGVALRTFDSLRLYPNFRLYFTGQTVSATGTWLQTAAQAWMVLQLTHSALAVGLVAFWQFCPYTLLGLFGGALSDRLNHRKTLIATQAALAACAAVLAVFAFAHGGNVNVVYAVAAARGIVMVLNNPSEQALLVRMVGRRELANAISLNAGSMNATRIVGPGLAGVVIAAAGVGVCFALNALSFVAVIASLVLVRERDFFPTTARATRPGVLAGLGEGLRYAWRTPRASVALGLLAVISTLGINFGVVLPILAAQTLRSGAEVFGLITALFGLGALCGALFSASLGRPTWPLVLASAGVFALFEACLAPLRTVDLVVPLLIATGFGYTMYTALTNAMVQLSAPDELQGRAAGLYSWVFLGTGPLGALLSGWLSSVGGTELVFLVAGVGGGLATLGAALALRRGAEPGARIAPAPAQGPP
jgi:MFS family permease